MRRCLIALLLVTSLPPAAQTPGAVAGTRILTPRDVFALEQATDVQISPDGRRIVYVRSTGDIMTDGARRSLWLVDVAAGTQAPLLDGSACRPRWSPDGARLAFTMFVPDDGAKLGQGVAKPDGAKWAEPLKVITHVHYREDGEGYLRPGYTHLFVVPADGGAPRQLTDGKFDDDGGVTWSRDGRHIVFAANREPYWQRTHDRAAIWASAVDGGALTRLAARPGANHEPQVSPDGRLIAFTGADDHGRAYENEQLSVMNADGSNVRVLSGGLDRSLHAPRWSADGRSIVAAYDDHGVTRVARFGLDGPMTELAAGLAGGDLDRPYSGGMFSLARTGAVAFTMGDPTSPPDVGIATGGRIRRLTRLNDGLFAGKTLGAVTAHHVASSADGQAIDYWQVTPPGFDPGRRYPTILEIHGGPYAAYAPVWSTEDQLYAAEGYVVVYANPRGSTSAGAAFADAIWKDYPSHDYDDLMSVVDDAVARGIADPANLFVTGGSGGGLLTAWIVGKTARFKAAVSQKPVINWTSEGLTTDGYTSMLRQWFGTTPWDNPDLLWAHSPLSLAGHVTTPTLLIVGEDDRRTPASEAEQFYAALTLRKVPTGLIRVPGASHHGLAERPSQLTAENAAILAWFARYRTGSVAGTDAHAGR